MAVSRPCRPMRCPASSLDGSSSQEEAMLPRPLRVLGWRLPARLLLRGSRPFNSGIFGPSRRPRLFCALLLLRSLLPVRTFVLIGCIPSGPRPPLRLLTLQLHGVVWPTRHGSLLLFPCLLLCLTRTSCPPWLGPAVRPVWTVGPLVKSSGCLRTTLNSFVSFTRSYVLPW